MRKAQLKKKSMLLLRCLLMCTLCEAAGAETSSLFSIRAECQVPMPFVITLCLNGKAPASCQNYTVGSSNLYIKTNIPEHNYSFIGIKADSALYRPSNCTLIDNGFCLFSANNSNEAIIVMESTTQFGASFVC